MTEEDLEKASTVVEWTYVPDSPTKEKSIQAIKILIKQDMLFNILKLDIKIADLFYFTRFS